MSDLEREKLLAKELGYRISGEDKYLVRKGDSEIGPDAATDCEMKLWAWLSRSESAPSSINSQEFQSALGKLSLAMGNPCIEFEAGKIEIGLIKYAAEFIKKAAPSDRAVWLAAINDELANLRAWANRAEADLRHTIFCMDRACKRCRDLMTKYPAPGESAHATHDNLSCAVCGKGMELVSGDPRAFYKCSSCGSDPELTAGELGESAHATPPITLKEFLWNGTTCRLHGHGCCDDCLKLEALAMHVHLNAAGEAGSPAPAPTYVGVDFGRGKDATGYHCSVCGDSLEPCEHWVKFEAAPAPTEEK